MKLYSTLTGEATEFAPADGNTVKMYVCGVTPYSSTHIGHALSYVAFDVLRRYLEHLGFTVRHVQNFTDIEDKLIERSHDTGTPVEELAEPGRRLAAGGGPRRCHGLLQHVLVELDPDLLDMP